MARTRFAADEIITVDDFTIFVSYRSGAKPTIWFGATTQTIPKYLHDLVDAWASIYSSTFTLREYINITLKKDIK